MDKVSGRSKIEYNLNQKMKKILPEGEEYGVVGSDRLRVVLLNDRSREKQQEIEATLRGEDPFSTLENIQDVAFSRGKFVGYIYSYEKAEEPVFMQPPLEIEDINTKSSKNVKKGIAENLPIKMLALTGTSVLIGVLNIKVIYFLYIGLVVQNFEESVARGCALIGINGFASLACGVILMLFTIMKMHKKESTMGVSGFTLLGSITLLVGIVVADLLSFLIVVLVCGVLNILSALIPSLIVIGVIVLVIKSMFKR